MAIVPHDSIDTIVPRYVLLTIAGNGHRLILSISSTLLSLKDQRAVVKALRTHRGADRLLDGEPYLLVREDGAEPFDPRAEGRCLPAGRKRRPTEFPVPAMLGAASGAEAVTRSVTRPPLDFKSIRPAFLSAEQPTRWK